MALLIDGYNLIHAAGIVGQAASTRGPGGLERSRLALLNFLGSSLDDAARDTTIVVFDAAGAPPGLPDTMQFRGIAVRFARGYATADELLAELIQADSAPRRLTVVSSDHGVQRAAKRRRATAVDSDVWYADVLRQRRERTAAPAMPEARSVEPRLSDEEVAFWLRQFDESRAIPSPAEDAIFPAGYAEDVESETGEGTD